jgi:hypothetical protein
MNEKATAGIDAGYDGLNIDDFPNMYFLNGDNQLVIQGEGYFDTNASYPLGVKTDAEGKVMIDGLENFDINQNIFIYDSTDSSYHNIKMKIMKLLFLREKTMIDFHCDSLIKH